MFHKILSFDNTVITSQTGYMKPFVDVLSMPCLCLADALLMPCRCHVDALSIYERTDFQHSGSSILYIYIYILIYSCAAYCNTAYISELDKSAHAPFGSGNIEGFKYSAGV